MSRRPRKKDLFDIFDFDEGDFLLGSKSFSGRGSGYSISVSYDKGGKPVVKVETRDDVDVGELRRDIERHYPGAKIEGLEMQPVIRIIDEKPAGDKKQEENDHKAAKKKRPLIRAIE